MNRDVVRGAVLTLTLLALMAGCARPGAEATPERAREEPPATAPIASVPAVTPEPITQWESLMPEDRTYERPPPQLGRARNPGMDGIGGLIDDTGTGTTPGMVIDHTGSKRAEQFGSSLVSDDVDGRALDLDGYVVPLGTNDAGLVDEVLFVSFYGACIHVPPPPPNQIIHVHLSQPIALGSLSDPWHLSGTLRVERFDAEIASASYGAAEAVLTPISG